MGTGSKAFRSCWSVLFIFNISLSKLSFIFLNTEAPEQAYDPRTLYERLKEQKDKKQEEYEESKKLKNFVKGLEDDEVEFLQNVDEQKAILENQKYEEEMNALEEFKKTKTNKITEDQDQLINDAKKEVFGSTSSSKKATSQTSKLSKMIKRKPQNSNITKVPQIPESDEVPSDSKKPKIQEDKPSNGLSSLMGYSDSDSE